MKVIKTIEQSTVEVLNELKRLKYSDFSINTYRNCYNGLLKYTRENNICYYSEKIGLDYLKYKFDMTLEGFYGHVPKKVSSSMRSLHLLWDYQEYGKMVFKTRPKDKPFGCPAQFLKEYEAFRIVCAERKYTELGLKSILNPLHKFLTYLDDHQIKSSDQIDQILLTKFISSLLGYTTRYIATIISSLRNYLTFLYQEQFIATDLSRHLPKIRVLRNAFLPSSWNIEDVKKLLLAVDRGNPTGKRDYALLLLVVRTGLRASDVRALKLSDLNWGLKKIIITQKKTKQTLELPILDDVGWALIDYLKNGRPETSSDAVFIRHKAPYDAFRETDGLQKILWKYMAEAEIKIPRDRACGLHSLRSTLARTMLENNAPLQVISEVLGHVDLQTASIYLKIDLDGLRNCALDPEEVFRYEG
jgi:integrase/recombinase XerD